MPNNWVRPRSTPGVLRSALLVVVLLAGGGGAEGPLQNGIIAATGAFLLSFVIADQLTGQRPIPRHGFGPALVAITLLAIPLAQLVPLPPAFWQSLPGRDYAVQALQEIGSADSWRPLSLHPEATMRSAAAMLLPVGLFLLVLRAPPQENRIYLWLLIACAGASGAIGAGQLALGHPDWLTFYDGPSLGAASGVFANPNHQSLLMAIAMVACGVAIRSLSGPRIQVASRSRVDRLSSWGAMTFFAVMTLASGSRAGVLLLGVALPGALLVALGRGSVLRWTAAMFGTVAMLSIVILLYPATNSLAVREEFRIGADARYAFLPDILYTLDQHWPFGSGLGTFADVFAPYENLDLAQRGYLNHAHNDFLEWLIETGLPGGIWLGLAATVVGYGCYRLYRHPGDNDAAAVGGILMLLLVAAHSVVDYPLRTGTLAAVTAVAAGLIFAGANDAIKASSGSRKFVPGLIAALVATPVAVESARLFMVEWALREGRATIAPRLGPGNTDVLASQAKTALQAGRPSEAERLAASAVRAQPMNSAAVRALAMSRDMQHRPSRSAWRLASSLGWRDTQTQLWAFRQALVDDEPEVAGLRADALLRTGNPPVEFVQLVQEAASQPDFAAVIANRLRVEAPWRKRFFTLARAPSAKQVAGVTAVLQQIATTGEQPERSDGRSLISYFMGEREYERAIEIDLLVSGDRMAAGNLIDDGGFSRSLEDYAANSTAFDWLLHRGDHAAGSIDPTPPGVLQADSDGERTELVASRYLQLAPGAYGFSYRVRSDQPESFQVRLVCVNRSDTLLIDVAPSSAHFSNRSIDVAVEPGCPLVRLLIVSLPSGIVSTAAFDDFTMVRR